MTIKAQKEQERNEAIKDLKKLLGTKNRVIYCNVNHVSKSGMSRDISFHIVKKNDIIGINFYVAKITENKRTDRGIRVGGCGMDMGFHIVYQLGRYLYPGGDGKTIIGRNGDKEPETDGGYLIKHRWL